MNKIASEYSLCKNINMNNETTYVIFVGIKWQNMSFCEKWTPITHILK